MSLFLKLWEPVGKKIYSVYPFCFKNLSLDDTLWRFSFPLKLLNRESCFSNFQASAFLRGGNQLSEKIHSVMLVVGMNPLADLGFWTPTWILIWWSFTLTIFYNLSDVWSTVIGGNWSVIFDRFLDKMNLKIMLEWRAPNYCDPHQSTTTSWHSDGKHVFTLSFSLKRVNLKFSGWWERTPV